MGEKSDRVLTETFRDKRYEDDLTKLFFKILEDVGAAMISPTIENTRVAFSSTVKVCTGLVFSTEHLIRYDKKVTPVFNAIRLILYGDTRLPSVQAVMREYNVRVVKIHGKDELESGQEIVTQLSEIIFLVKQWAYEEGMFLPKPIDRKYGTDAISEVLEQ